MAMGKAVVATDHPEQRLIINESGGGLCVPYDETAVAEALIALLKDPVSRRTMGRRGRAYVMRHRTYNVIADIVEQTYYDVAGI
jgi:glycosyltransferase involved in cell wall biosynthesis